MSVNPNQTDNLLKKGIEAAEKGYIHSAQVFLGQVAEERNSPELQSYLAYCQAKGQGRMAAAAKICRDAIQSEPNNPTHHLIMGRIMLLSGDKAHAIDAFRQGLKGGGDERIINELSKLGLRRPPVIKILKRSHPLNRWLGKVLGFLGIR